MLVARLACLRSVPLTGLRPMLNQGCRALRSPILRTHSPLLRTQQGHSSKPRPDDRRPKEYEDIFEDPVFEPLDVEVQFDRMGRRFLIMASVYGLGLVAYYGLGLSNTESAIDKSVFWPQFVKDRINSTYMYFAGTAGLTALSAYAVGRTPQLMSLMTRGSLMAIGATFAAVTGLGMLVKFISYEHSPVFKHLAWMLHAGVMGAVIAPLPLLGGPRMIRAALTIAGTVGGLTLTAVCAPNEEYLNNTGPVAVLFGVILTSSIGALHLPPSSIFASGLYSIAVYIGLLLFIFFLLYDTSKVIKRAENYPRDSVEKYDPINAGLGMYADTLNIFARLMEVWNDSRGIRK
ncbi:growth hormone-inducible transmembrane protein-like [Halichoeres trimaculatus]|uniref:growth hormone-inducible transmembrane protein-like n=1 Tax=Halichoeres trimaculatus TaxID=147232 RepID=UPI003D9E8172